MTEPTLPDPSLLTNGELADIELDELPTKACLPIGTGFVASSTNAPVAVGPTNTAIRPEPTEAA